LRRLAKLVLSSLRGEGASFVSGERLSEALGVSRTAIWKAMEELKRRGYPIESHKKLGYRLLSQDQLYNDLEVELLLEDLPWGHPTLFFDEVPSTQDVAKQLALQGAPEGLLVVADRQSSGRGRKGRPWESPPGSGIWASILLRPNLSPAFLHLINFAAGLSVKEAITALTGIEDVKLKWPNDVLIGGKKVCGILTEGSVETDRILYCVLGIGINVSGEGLSEALSDKATSLSAEAKRRGLNPPSRLQLLAELVRRLYGRTAQALSEESERESLLREYKASCETIGREILFEEEGSWRKGIALDVDEFGHLVVRSRGSTRRIASSDVFHVA